MAVSPPPEIQMPVPHEARVEDRDTKSGAITSVVGSLFDIDLADRDAVARQLRVRWVATASSVQTIESYRGVDGRSGAPFEAVEYRRSVARDAARWSDLTLRIPSRHCYSDRALVFNYAPDNVATPYTLPDGDAKDISSRATFTRAGKKVVLAYRRGPAGAECVAEIFIKQSAPS